MESYQKSSGSSDQVIFVDIDGGDNFFDFLQFLDSAYLKEEFTFVIFSEDIYCACKYHLAIAKKTIVDMLKKEWNDTKISLELLQ